MRAEKDGTPGTRLRRVAVLFLALFVVAETGHARIFKDMAGLQVSLERPPARIVSLAPSLTETIYALGAQESLVGVTTLCDYPPEARRKAKVGGMVNPSLEAILRLRPDLVLATTEGNRGETIAELTRLGVPTYVVSPKSLAGVLESVRRIGELIGREETAGRVVADLARRRDRIVEATRGRPTPTVLYLVWADPAIVPGRDTLIADLIHLAGGASVSAEERIDWPRLSLEEIVARAPEVIITPIHNVAHVDDGLRRWREQKIFVPALRTGRVHAVDGDLVHRPGPRVVDGLDALARAIHGGALPP